MTDAAGTCTLSLVEQLILLAPTLAPVLVIVGAVVWLQKNQATLTTAQLDQLRDVARAVVHEELKPIREQLDAVLGERPTPTEGRRPSRPGR